MKSTLIRVAAVMITVMLLLTGCNLYGQDSTKDYGNVIVEFADGTNLTISDMINVYNDQYSYYAYMYYMTYYQIPADLGDYVKNQTVNAYIEQEVVKRHAEEYGVTMTEEMEAEATEAAQAEWEQYLESYISQYLSDAEDEAVARSEAIAAVEELGYGFDYMLTEHRDSVLVSAIAEAMTADVTAPTDTDLTALYEQKVAANEESYSASTDAYEAAVSSGNTVYWNPEGYRAVQHILLKPEDETLLDEYVTAYDNKVALDSELMSAAQNGSEDETRTLEVITEEVNAAGAALKDVENRILAACQPTIDEINAKLEAGAAFPDLINDYTADSDGLLYVSANTSTLIAPFQTGAMALEKVGDVSAPIVGDYGVHLIYYASDVTPGAVPMADVQEGLEADALQNAKNEMYEATVDQWIEEAGVTTYLDRWNTAD